MTDHAVQLKNGSVEYVSDEELLAMNEMFPDALVEPINALPRIERFIYERDDQMALIFYSKEGLLSHMREVFPANWPAEIIHIKHDTVTYLRPKICL